MDKTDNEQKLEMNEDNDVVVGSYDSIERCSGTILPEGNFYLRKVRLEDYDDVYISGDAFDFLAEELSGSFVTQSRLISHRISSDINSSFDYEQYTGSVTLSAMTGLSKGITVSYTYDKRPKAPTESTADFRFKKHYSDFYFSSLLRGII